MNHIYKEFSSATPSFAPTPDQHANGLTATTAAMAAFSCGFSPTDPQLQPFLKSVYEEHIRLHANALISNGMPEVLAYEQARQNAGDRSQFFGQAVLKYFEGLSQATDVSMNSTNSQYSNNAVITSLPHSWSSTGNSGMFPDNMAMSMGAATTPLVPNSHISMPAISTPATTDATAASTFPQIVAGTAQSINRISSLPVNMYGMSLGASPGTKPVELSGNSYLSSAETFQSGYSLSPWSTTSSSHYSENTVTEASHPQYGVTTGNSTAEETFKSSISDSSQQKTNTSGLSDIIANVRFNLNKAKGSRFDIPASTTVTTSPQTTNPNLLHSIFNSGLSTYPPPTAPAQIQVQQTMQQYLQTVQQQWTYRVFSALQTPPRAMTVKQWRQHVSNFVQNKMAQVQTAYAKGQPLPNWLTSCSVPTVSEVLGQHPDSFSVQTDQVGPLPPDDSDNMSPVSTSSSNSERQNFKASEKANKYTSYSQIVKRQPYGNAHRKKPWVEIVKSGESTSEESTGVKKVSLRSLKKQDRNKNLKAVKKQQKKRSVALFPNNMSATLSVAEELQRRQDRIKRFGIATENDNSDNVITLDDDIPTGNLYELNTNGFRQNETIQGRNMALEKPYLRLCGPPNPADIRPLEVLQKSFNFCLSKWKSKPSDYRYIEEQFRSIRQDLTVQGIQNEFTIQVYETNARIALKYSDLGQFNQCQTQLRELHKKDFASSPSRIEFLAYRFLYLTLTHMKQELVKLLGDLSEQDAKQPALQFALVFRKAFTDENYHRLFRLIQSNPPNSSVDLILIFIDQLRMMYLVSIAKAHYTASISYLSQELGFNSESACRDFLQKQNTVWSEEKYLQTVDCRQSLRIFESSPLLHRRKMSALG